MTLKNPINSFTADLDDEVENTASVLRNLTDEFQNNSDSKFTTNLPNISTVDPQGNTAVDIQNISENPHTKATVHPQNDVSVDSQSNITVNFRPEMKVDSENETGGSLNPHNKSKDLKISTKQPDVVTSPPKQACM